MSIGFDFGTANCSVAQVVSDAEANTKVRTIPLNGQSNYIRSTLCAPNRESVSEYLFRHLDIRPIGEVAETLLTNSVNRNRRERIDVKPNDILFGEQATAWYLEDPVDTYYVKSPKSFLGLLGLDQIRFAIFEDIICAMMANVKSKTEAYLGDNVSEVVIGRPVNFYSRGGDKSNQQAIGILNRAASRAGYKHIEFQYEPVAAGFDYESSLTSNKNVLVVDIGGGTSDCSLIQMGPSWVGKTQRNETFLGHSGIFTGGNDLDIHLANAKIMHELGKGSDSKSGLPLPNMPFWDAIAINDVVAQKRFYAQSNLSELRLMQRDAMQPEKLERLIQVHENTLGYGIVAEAERVKISLSTQRDCEAKIQLPNDQLRVRVSAQQMEEAVDVPVAKISSLIEETIAQAAIKPDVIYMTGGSARSPVVRKAVSRVVANTPIQDGDYFGSVTAGLARWAELSFR